MTTPYYDIDGNRIPDWPMTGDRDTRRIGADDLPGDVRVSTVHLVLDHQYSEGGAPLIFETMIFGGEQDEWQCRYATKENAAAGHKATVACGAARRPRARGRLRDDTGRVGGQPMTKPPSSPVRKRPTALRAVLLVVTASLLAGCSIESHDSRLDHCLKAHDVDHGSSGVTTVCDEYDLPWKDGH